jgi:hypothetical protein
MIFDGSKAGISFLKIIGIELLLLIFLGSLLKFF